MLAGHPSPTCSPGNSASFSNASNVLGQQAEDLVYVFVGMSRPQEVQCSDSKRRSCQPLTRETGSGGCFYSPGTCCLPAYSGGIYLQDCHQVCAESLDQGVFWSREFWGGRYYISIIKYYESHSKWQSTCEINHSFHWLVGGWLSLAKSFPPKKMTWA